MKAARGFTLIEIMIVVAIVAILGAIAYPSYQSQVEKSRRADGKEAVLNAAALQERWYMRQSQYVIDNADIDNVGGNESEEGYYTISVSNQPCGSNACFTVIATAQGAQTNDADCQILSVNSLGVKASADGTSDSATDTTATCW